LIERNSAWNRFPKAYNGGYKLYLTNSDGKSVATKAHAIAEPKPGETLSVKVDDFYGEKE
jgi:hypothetical protein